MKTAFSTLLKNLLPIAALVLASTAPAETTTNTDATPVVTIHATTPQGTWSGMPVAFTVVRHGNTTPALNVYCCIGGTASNGVDYAAIGNIVPLASGAVSNTVVIQPINLGQTNVKTISVTLCPSPLMSPVNYAIGSPSNANLYISTGNSGGTTLPVVTVSATDTNAAESGLLTVINPGVFTLRRTGATNHSWPVYYAMSGTASNGVDYTALSGTAVFPAGAATVNVTVNPLNDNLVEGTETAVIRLLPIVCTTVYPPPVGCYTVGSPAEARVYIADANVPPPTNQPPCVRITSPANGTVFTAPVNIPLYAYAGDPDGVVTNVEFFRGTARIGTAQRLNTTATGINPTNGSVTTGYWFLMWTNAPLGTNFPVFARATDNLGAVAGSPEIHLTVRKPELPHTNTTPVVSIVATDPVAIEGTNCWPWRGLVPGTAGWSSWNAGGTNYHYYTNCGPKNATFAVYRVGSTNESLNVGYEIGGTATNGVQYVALPGVVTVPAGLRRATIAIVPLEDGKSNRNTTVILRLKPAVGYVVGRPAAAAALILDSRTPRPVTGLNSGATFTLAASGPDCAWFRIEVSADNKNWTSLCTNQVVNGSINYVDPETATGQTRFYRAVPEANPPAQ